MCHGKRNLIIPKKFCYYELFEENKDSRVEQTWIFWSFFPNQHCLILHKPPRKIFFWNIFVFQFDSLKRFKIKTYFCLRLNFLGFRIRKFFYKHAQSRSLLRSLYKFTFEIILMRNSVAFKSLFCMFFRNFTFDKIRYLFPCHITEIFFLNPIKNIQKEDFAWRFSCKT